MIALARQIGAEVAALAVAPLVMGLCGRTKAFLTGRRGAPILQPYRDLAKLLRKGAVISRTTTPVFSLGTVAYVVTALGATVLVPFDGRRALVGFAGDVVLFTGLLAAGRYALVLAALDTGSSFEGMGASREVLIGGLVEPGLMVCLMVPMLATGQLSLGGAFGGDLAAAWSRDAPALVISGVCLFALLLAEAGRVPVDDPATHLELTMIHEVMVLDHGGPDLGLIQYAAAVRLTTMAVLVLNVLAPHGAMASPGALLALLAGLTIVAVAVGAVESVMGRLRLSRVPQVLVATTMLATIALILALH